MALWDYHVSGGGPSFVGLTDARLAAVRAEHPRGRVVESVAHLSRVAGDDETDHIMRHRYGVDPASYRASFEGPRARVSVRPSASRRSEPRRSEPRRSAAPRARTARARAPRAARLPGKLTLSKLVRAALREAPGLESKLARLVKANAGRAATRHSFLGLPLVITSTARTTRVRFEHER